VEPTPAAAETGPAAPEAAATAEAAAAATAETAAAATAETAAASTSEATAAAVAGGHVTAAATTPTILRRSRRGEKRDRSGERQRRRCGLHNSIHISISAKKRSPRGVNHAFTGLNRA
jgi:hypothetical protein